MDAPKIILFDIETLPNLNKALEVWCHLSSFPGRTMKASITSIICVGWKVLGEKKTHCINAWDFPEWGSDVNNDKQICLALHEILKDVDAVITHNGKRFDWKHLQTRFLINGLDPLPNIIHIDTCILARRHLLMFSNKLDYLGEYFVKDKKLENGGWNLWIKVHKRIKASQKLMEKYCKQDVILLEKLFLKLRPFVKNLPNRNIDIRNPNFDYVCPSCGSADLTSNGWVYTSTTKYRRLKCKSCGGSTRLDKYEKNPRSI